MKQKTKIILFGATGLMLLGSFTLGNLLYDSSTNMDKNVDKDVDLSQEQATDTFFFVSGSIGHKNAQAKTE